MDTKVEVNPYDLGTSGLKWAEYFMETIQEHNLTPDIDLMITWFCNAIEVARAEGHDQGILDGRNGAKTQSEIVDMILAPLDHE